MPPPLAVIDYRRIAAVLADRPDVSMAEIGRAAGVGKATLYRHFSCREELLSATVQEECQRMLGILFPAYEAAQGLPIGEQLEHGARALMAYRQDSPGGFRLLLQNHAAGPFVADALSETCASASPTWRASRSNGADECWARAPT
jgi:AcrR family transcriptional regulator